jgi:hypothetical protein
MPKNSVRHGKSGELQDIAAGFMYFTHHWQREIQAYAHINSQGKLDGVAEIFEVGTIFPL